MGHFSKKYTHTLESAPTIGALYQHMRNDADEGVKNGGDLAVGSTTLSVLFYQDLHDFIDSIVDFPYETEFVNDEDVTYSTSASASSSTCKIGTMQYVPYISTGFAGEAENAQKYIPWMAVDPEDYHKVSGQYSIRKDYFASNQKYGTTFRQVANCRKGGEGRVYEWTLHCYYNTHYCLIGFTNENTDKMISILTQVDAVDRLGRDWYFVTSIAGYSFLGNNNVNEPYGLIEFHLKDHPKKLPTLTGAGIIQHYSTGGVMPYGNLSFLYSGDVYTIKGVDIDGAQVDYLFDNPCIAVGSNYAIGKFQNLQASPLYFANDLTSAEDVVVSYPIVLRGLMALTDQVMCASDNIILSKEYVYNGKKYYCAGDPAVTSLNMPFLFEFDTAE